MRCKLAIAIFLVLGLPAFAHRLDEYLQATIISLEKDRVEVFLRLIPGVAVAPTALASIDANGDGVLSDSEHQAYAEKVLHDLTLSIDGKRLKPRLRSIVFPAVAEMKDGLGEIQMEFSAVLPSGGADRKLIFENHHQGRISVYLVNCLAPRDHKTAVIAQHRNENQSFYQLDYKQAGGGADGWLDGWLVFGTCLSALALLLSVALILRRRLHWVRRVTPDNLPD